MDANGARFWLLAEPRHLPGGSDVSWCASRRVLRLASQRRLDPVLTPAAAFALAQNALEQVPRAIDALQGLAWWDAARSAVLASSHLPGSVALLPLTDTPTDLCAAPDGVLYVALPGRVLMHDLRARWDNTSVSLPGFQPWRLAPAAGGGVWVLERASGRIARLSGLPLPAQTPAPDDYDGRTFRPMPENGRAPRLTLLPALPDNAVGERHLGLAAGPDGVLHLLSWAGGDGLARLRRWRDPGTALPGAAQADDVSDPPASLADAAASAAALLPSTRSAWAAQRAADALQAAARQAVSQGTASAAQRRLVDADVWPAGRWSEPIELVDAAYAYALACNGSARVLVRVPGRVDAPAYDLASAAAGRCLPLGDIHPLPVDSVEAGFANGLALPPHVPVGAHGSAPAHVLSLQQYARRGSAANWADKGGASSTGTVDGGGSAADEAQAAWLIDSGSPATVWHRLYAEAHLPAQTGLVVWLATSNAPEAPAWDEALIDRLQWHPHAFGAEVDQIDPALQAPQLPHAVWEHAASELPGHPGLLGGTREPGRRGLFSVLIQNSRTRVRSLVGRYLWVRVVLHGNGRSTPELAALRAWGGRFDYAAQYLPRLYHEQLHGADAELPGQRVGQLDIRLAGRLDAAAPGTEPSDELLLDALRQAGLPVPMPVPVPVQGQGQEPAQVQMRLPVPLRLDIESPGSAWLLQLGGRQAWRLCVEADPASAAPLPPPCIGIYKPQATPADFNARMLASFEGLLTPLEDRIAAAHLYSDPDATPEACLPWLAGWIGVAFDPALPRACQRSWLAAAPELARSHGTLAGLRLALDIASHGAVQAGQVVVVEDFRLRRILATLLGVDLSNEHDPLLPGLSVSGNSVVGDTLVLGDHAGAELLALFDAPVASAAGNRAVATFQQELAHRATVLVHQELQAVDLGLLRRIVQLEAPAHVDVRVLPATWPLLVGIASLVGVDTFLGPPRPPQPVRAGVSSLGNGDLVLGPPLLDPRLAGATPPAEPPIARAGARAAGGTAADLQDEFSVPYGQGFVLDASGSAAAPGRQLSRYHWRWLAPPA